MKNVKKEITILGTILQQNNKLWFKCFINSKDKKFLLYFLWKIGYIYGFKNSKKFLYIIYSKNIKNRRLYLAKKSRVSYKILYKINNWEKFNILILKTSNGLSTSKQVIKAKLGGYLIVSL